MSIGSSQVTSSLNLKVAVNAPVAVSGTSKVSLGTLVSITMSWDMEALLPAASLTVTVTVPGASPASCS